MRNVPERLTNVLRDYVELTNTSLSPEECQVFFSNQAVKRLSMHDREVRIRAGKKARKTIDTKTFTLNPLEWIDELYEFSSGNGGRVWVTRGGFRFHDSRDCKALLDGQSKAESEGKDTYKPDFVKIEMAIQLGKKPCRICKP